MNTKCQTKEHQMVLTLAQQLNGIQHRYRSYSHLQQFVQDPCDQKQQTPQAQASPDALGCNGVSASQVTGIKHDHAQGSRTLQYMCHIMYIRAF